MVELVYTTQVCINGMRLHGSMDVKDKRVVITGGNSGIGFSLAKQVLSSGASVVVLVARNEGRLKKCVEELNLLKDPTTQTVFYLSIDLSSDPEKVKQKMDELCSTIGSIHVLINCAGFSIPGEFKDLPIASFSDMINANYFSAVYISHAVIPHMLQSKSPCQLIYLSSVGGQLGIYGFTAYAPSKYAIRGFAEVLYHELRPYDIGVSIVFPPDTETPGLAQENLLKPKVTQVISEQAGLWKSEDVASVILDGIKARKFMIGFGSDGYFVNALTCGSSPPSSTIEFWLQCLLMSILRLYMLFMNTFFTSVINKEHSKKMKLKDE